MANNNEEEEEAVAPMVKLGSYGGEVRLVVGGEESAAEETMLLWGIQQPTLSKPNAFVSQASLQLSLDSCGHSLSILQSPSSLMASALACAFSNDWFLVLNSFEILDFCFKGTPGVTGAVMWDSGVVLGKFLEHAVDSGMLVLQGKKIVELGSGCGLVGCIATLLGSEVIVTDLPDRLRLLRKNIETNMKHVSLRGSVTATELTWGEDPDPELIDPKPDFVIGSDVVYSEGAVVDLLETLMQLSGPNTTIFLAGELRNDAILEYFLEAAMDNFTIGRVEQTLWHPDYCSNRVVIYVLFQTMPYCDILMGRNAEDLAANWNSVHQDLAKLSAVAWGAGEALVIEEVEVSPPQPMEIRIKVVSTSLCRSDLSAWESHAIFPRIFGHEASGAHLEKATLVVLGLERMGLMHSDQKTRFSVKGEPVYDYCAVSSFSEYTVVHSGCAVKLSPLAPLEKICLLSCGVAAAAPQMIGKETQDSVKRLIIGFDDARGIVTGIGLGAAWNVADVSKGSTVVIFGLGTVGLSVIKCITDGRADFSFECGWGLTVTLGVPKVKLEMSARYGLLLMGRTLKGSLFWGWKPKSDLPSLVKKYLNKVTETVYPDSSHLNLTTLYVFTLS
ncbi:hypothetical protein JHK84_045384 [Glycine max]|nr:hypothetical protein JHK84_045384 [Glycine max]